MKHKFMIHTESLLVMRDKHLKDIEFIKTTEYKCDDDKFICKYLLHLEQQIESINEELIERGVI